MTEIRLDLENCRSLPERGIVYLDAGQVHPEFRNKSNLPIKIEQVYCAFQTEKGLIPYEASISMPQELRPRQLARFEIPFRADLGLTAATNSYSIKASGRAGDAPFSKEFPGRGYLIIHDIRSTDKHFFISHKDPENTDVAKRLAHYLKKIGFYGFVAENEKRPGVKLWPEKILPAIDGCFGFVILWTEEARAHPENLLRELARARDGSKRMVLLWEDRAGLPDGFTPLLEYVRLPAKVGEQDLVNLVTYIENTYRIGGYGT